MAAMPAESQTEGLAATTSSQQHLVRRAVSRIVLGAEIVLLLAVSGWASVGVLYAQEVREGRIEGTTGPDHAVFYAVGAMVRHGEGDGLYIIGRLGEQEAQLGYTEPRAFFNPPFVALLFAPLSVLPFSAAVAVLGGLCALMAAITAWQVGGVMAMGRYRLYCAVAFLSFPPVIWAVVHGQMSPLFVLAWLGFLALDARGRKGVAGFALALLLIKPQLAILPAAWLLWDRRYASLGALVLATLTVGLVSLAVAGPAVVWHYPHFVVESAKWQDQGGIHTASMYGWNGLWARLVGDGSSISLALVAVSSMLTLAAVAYTARRHPPACYAVPVLVMASLLINPHLYTQDLVLVALPLSLAVARRDGWYRGWIALAAATWALLYISPPARSETPFTGALIVLFAAAIWASASHTARIGGGAAPVISAPSRVDGWGSTA